MILYRVITYLILDVAIEAVFKGVCRNFAVEPIQYVCPVCNCGMKAWKRTKDRRGNPMTGTQYILECLACDSFEQLFMGNIGPDPRHPPENSIYESLFNIYVVRQRGEVEESWDAKGNRLQ